jgi:hypothetical protein
MKITVILFLLGLVGTSCHNTANSNCVNKSVPAYGLSFCCPKEFSEKSLEVYNDSFSREYEITGAKFVAFYFDRGDSSFLLIQELEGEINNSHRAMVEMYQSKAFGLCPQPAYLKDSTFDKGMIKGSLLEYMCEYKNKFLGESKINMFKDDKCIQFLFSIKANKANGYNQKLRYVRSVLKSVQVY